MYGFTDGVRDRVFGHWFGSGENEDRSYSNWSERSVSDIDDLIEQRLPMSTTINA